MIAEEFAASVGFDALRISMGGKPRLHDVETICRWLRHVSAQGIEAEGRNAEGSSVHESPIGNADAPEPLFTLKSHQKDAVLREPGKGEGRS